MSFLALFLEFLKIGLFTFGGAYGAIPLIRETVLTKGWMDDAMFSNMLAISESTPGPIMVNAATYIGSTQGGIAGASLATMGVVLPSFVVIVLISSFLKKYFEKPPVRAVLSGVKSCVAGMILATGISMIFSMVGEWGKDTGSNLIWLGIFSILAAITVLYGRIKKKPFSPVLLIGISAVLGMVFY